jgi:hypothetical protein
MSSDLVKVLVKKGQVVSAWRITLYGMEKIGKSTFAKDAPNPLFLCSEAGLIAKEFAETANIEIASWLQLRNVVAELATSEHDYKTIGVDTIDWVEEKLAAFIIANANDAKIKSIEAFGYGKGEMKMAEEWKNLLAELERCWKRGIHIILLAHCQIKPFNNPTGDNYDRYEMKCTKKIGALCREWSDAVLFAKAEVYTKKDGMKTKAFGDDTRVIVCTPSPAWEAGTRLGIPEKLPLSWSDFEVAAKGRAGEEEIKSLVADITLIINSADVAVMPETLKVQALAALERDKGNISKLRLLKNKIKVAINN